MAAIFFWPGHADPAFGADAFAERTIVRVAVAGPLAGKLVGALTQEQQQELEAVLHEATAAHEMGGLHSEFESNMNPCFV